MSINLSLIIESDSVVDAVGLGLGLEAECSVEYLLRVVSEIRAVSEEISDIEAAGLNRKLRIPDPFSSIYILYLQCMIHLALGEYDKYSSLYAFYNSAFEDYAKWYMRNRA